MKFAETRSGAVAAGKPPRRAPARTVTIRPDDFADEFASKPSSNIVAGLRLLSADEMEGTDEIASKKTRERFDNPESDEAVAFYNRRVQEWAVSRALCDPNDVQKPHPTFPMAEQQVPVALTAPAIARLWDELERLAVEVSPLHPEADEESLMTLSDLLNAPDFLETLPPVVASRVRRFAQFILDDVAAHLPEESA